MAMETPNPESNDSVEPQQPVRVVAPARLHLGFLDLGGHLGRRFGSVGVTIDGIATEIRVYPAKSLRVSGEGSERVRELIVRLSGQLGLPLQMHIQVSSRIPPHAGLGSGTQMALAVGVAISRFWGHRVTPRQIARLSGRGGRSGIGIAAFEGGGFIVDGGRGSVTQTPPLLSRLAVPESWCWLLIFDPAFQGLHGKKESEAFLRLPRFPREVAARLCHSLLIQGLPALAEGSYEAFCETLAEIQRANGDYFAPAQGGSRYVSSQVAEVLACMSQRGWVGLGQSSWGPTGFCLFPDSDTAAGEMEFLQERFGGSGIRFQRVASRNHGARIDE